MALPPMIPEMHSATYNMSVGSYPVLQVMDELYEKLESIGERKAFGQSLIMYYNKKGGISPVQESWARWLLAKAMGLADVPNVSGSVPLGEAIKDAGGLKKVPQMFGIAKTKLKWPKFNVMNSDGKVLTLKLAGAKSKYPGGVHVTSNHKNGTWYGTISVDGMWVPSFNAKSLPNLYQTLLDLATDPAKMAKAYGSKFGSCCFCHKKLTDPQSVQAGYGPICASHYGLIGQYNVAGILAKKVQLTANASAT